jgi:hypothetical protein
VGMRTKVEANESLLICDNPWEFRLDDENGLDRMLYWLNERKPKLVILDPLRDFHALEEKDSGGMNRLLRPLRQWAVENGACVLIVHHTTKRAPGDVENYSAGDLRGTSALFGIADGVLMLTPKGGPELVVRATFKRAKGWERTIRISAYDYLGPAAEVLDDQDQQVMRLIEKGAEDSEELIRQLHLSVEKLRTHLSKLERNGYIAREGGWWKPTRLFTHGGKAHGDSRGHQPLVHVPPAERGGHERIRRNQRGGEEAGGSHHAELPARRRPGTGVDQGSGGQDVGELSYRLSGKMRPKS